MRKLILVVLVLSSSFARLSLQSTVACDGFNTINPFISASATSIYLSECVATTQTIVTVNISLYGLDLRTNYPASVNYFTPATDGGSSVTIVPALTGAAAGLQWDMTANNTCMTISDSSATPAYCQYTLYVTNFSPTNYFDYEALSSNGFAIQVTPKIYRLTSSGCTWSTTLTVYVGFQDCDEPPVFQTASGLNFTISEYDGLSAASTYKGAICSLSVTDPDTYGGAFGAVTLRVSSVTRPNAGNVTADTSPFYISGASSFFLNNSNAAYLSYDVTRCSNVTACLAMFNAATDGGTYALYAVVVTATDDGGLNASILIYVYVTQIIPTPVWVNLPGNVTIAEDSSGPRQIFQIQMRILNPSSMNITSQISWATMNPLINGGNATYLAIDNNNCMPAPASPIICSGLNLTSAVTNTTLNFLITKKYNVTIWGLIIPPVSTGLPSTTITSSVIINIEGYNRQPNLVPNNDTFALPEDARSPACIYNLTKVVQDPNGDSQFTYTMKSVSQPGNNRMWGMYGSEICYDGSGTNASIGSCCGRVFRYGVSPYLIEVEIRDQHATPTPYPTFILTVSIFASGNPPILYTTSNLNVIETASSFSFVINATQNYPAPLNPQVLNFSIKGVSKTYNGQYFNMTQSCSINGGYAIITAGSANYPMFNALSHPKIIMNITVTDYLYTITSTLTIDVGYMHTPPNAINMPVNVTFLENVSGNAPIYTVIGIDRDNDPITYSFVNGSWLQQTMWYFAIDYYTGVVSYVNPSFDVYQTATYTLTILVQDHQTASLTTNATAQTLTVRLQLVNRPPSFTYPLAGSGQPGSTIWLYDNVTGQGILTYLNSTDREGDSRYYNITSMTPTWNYALNLEWGQSYLEYNQKYVPSNVTNMFDYFTTPVYYLVVEVKDAYHLVNATSTTTLTVSIVHADRPAVFVSMPGYVNVQEDAYFGPTELYAVAAMDPNNGYYPVVVNLQEVIPASGASKFYYDTYTKIFGYVHNPQFDWSTQNSYTIIFTASNTILPTVTSSIVVTVSRVYSTPSYSSTNYTVSVREDTTTSQLLWDIRSRNNDSTATYGLIIGTPNSGAFSVSNTGLCKTTSNPGFNYDQIPMYILTILGVNGNGQRVTYTLTVSIVAVAKSPVITNLPYTYTIQEGTGSGLNLYQVYCTDPRGYSLTWSLSVLPVSGTANFIATVTGMIRTATYANFTYVITPRYHVVIGCTNGFYTATGTLKVDVTIAPTTLSTSTTTTTPFGYTGTTASTTSTSTSFFTTTETGQSDELTPEKIGAIVGSIAGALTLAGVAFAIAKVLQKQAIAQGLTKAMKGTLPQHSNSNNFYNMRR